MKRAPLCLGLSVLFVAGGTFVLGHLYGHEAREMLTPMSPGVYVADFLVPHDACTQKEIPYDGDLATFYLFASNIVLYWFIGYALSR